MRYLTFTVLFFLLSTGLFAGSKMTKVDLDVKGTEIVRVELDVDDHYYYIDPTACICWVSRIIGSSNSSSTFDCSKLFAYQKLEAHLKKCKEVKEEAKVTEPAKEEPVSTDTPAQTEVEKRKI
jgi:hypothetical protein